MTEIEVLEMYQRLRMLVGAALYGLEFEKPRSHPVTMAFRLNQVEGNLEEALGLVRGLRGAEAGEVD